MLRNGIVAIFALWLFSVPLNAEPAVSQETSDTLFDIVSILERDSYYRPTQKEIDRFFQCMVERAFLRIEIKKNEVANLKKDIQIQSCFSGDKYAAYSTPEEVVARKRAEEGFVGIGVRIELVEKGARIRELISGGPAAGNGALKLDDIIVAAGEENGVLTPLANLSNAEISVHISGSEGTRVRLEVLRGGNKLRVTIVRARVKISRTEFRDLGDGIVYLKISEFIGRNIIREEVSARFADFYKKGMWALVLDLRGNPGGYTGAVIDFLVAFAPQGGELIYEVRNRDNAAENMIRSWAPGRYADVAIIVLVDGESASAAELAAGDLQHWGHLVIGSKTFGKGSMQKLVLLADGGVFKFTSHLFYMASGKSPEGVGITPDIKVGDDPATPQDEPLEKAKALLKERKR